MSKSAESRRIREFIRDVDQRNPHEPEFLQAVTEVAAYLIPFIDDHGHYQKHKILERLTEPEKIICSSIVWADDSGEVQINRAWRVQHNGALGPYKGGIRFAPDVNLSILKFLGFEQTFKNALTGLTLGGGKGGADFDPRGKSELEVMRFCQAFMAAMYRHLGEDKDVPAGDIGVGRREIGYMFGQYRHLSNEFTGILTGKGTQWGGSNIREESTGYGLIFFVEEMLKHKDDDLHNKTVVVSGAGNVALYAAEMAIRKNARVIALSDLSGSLHDPDGLDDEKLDHIKQLKNYEKGSLASYTKKYGNAGFYKNKPVWDIAAEIALPCATQNELGKSDAKKLAANGCMLVAEGANMACTPDAIKLMHSKGIAFAPGKASNAGGVATSGFEMAQNAMRLQWNRDKVEQCLLEVMQNIHRQCIEHGKSGKHINYVKGANIAAFIRIADAMIEQGYC